MSSTPGWLDCPTCHEANAEDRKECWFCHASLAEAAPGTPVEESPPRSARSEVLTVVLALGLATLSLGTFVSDPGAGISLALLLVFPLIRTTVIFAKRRKIGAESSSGQLLLLFLSSAAVTWLILTVVGIAAVGTFCFTCMGINSITRDDNVAVLVAGLTTLAVVLLLCYLFSKWVRSRWRRDTAGLKARGGAEPPAGG